MQVSGKKEFKAEITIKFESIEEAKALIAWLSSSSEELKGSELLNRKPELTKYINKPLEKSVIESIWNELYALTESSTMLVC